MPFKDAPNGIAQRNKPQNCLILQERWNYHIARVIIFFDTRLSYWRSPTHRQLSAWMLSPGSILRMPPLLLCLGEVCYLLVYNLSFLSYIFLLVVFSVRSGMITNSINVSLIWFESSSLITPMQEDGLKAVLKEIQSAKKTIADILEKELGQSPDNQRLVYFLHALRIFQAEFSVHLKNWDEITQIVEVECHIRLQYHSTNVLLIVQEVVQSGPSAVGTYEVIADILVCAQSLYLTRFSDHGNSGLTNPVHLIVRNFPYLLASC